MFGLQMLPRNFTSLYVLALLLQFYIQNNINSVHGSTYKRRTKFKRGLIDRQESDPMVYTDLGNGYRLFHRRLNWREALEYCMNCTGSMATFKNVEDAEKIIDVLYENSIYPGPPYYYDEVKSEFGLDRRYWIGLADDEDKPGEYVWVSQLENQKKFPDKEFEKLWWYDEPSHSAANGDPEFCIGFWNPNYFIDEYKVGNGEKKKKHFFNDFPCKLKHYFICSMENEEVGKDKEDCKAQLAREIRETDPPKMIMVTEKGKTIKRVPKQQPPTSKCDYQMLDEDIDDVDRAWITKWQAFGLEWHNKFREWHDVPPVELDEGLTKLAQSDADELVCFGKIGNENSGQNTFVSTTNTSEIDFSGSVISWYEDACQVVPASEFDGIFTYLEGELSHYTQIVWKTTRKVGIGVSRNGEQKFAAMVTRYDPVQSQDKYQENYKPPRCGERSYCNKKKKQLASKELGEIEKLCPKK